MVSKVKVGPWAVIWATVTVTAPVMAFDGTTAMISVSLQLSTVAVASPKVSFRQACVTAAKWRC